MAVGNLVEQGLWQIQLKDTHSSKSTEDILSL